MTLLLTNDDGIGAPGIAALAAAAAGYDCVTVAPTDARSQLSHAITTHEPIHLDERAEGEFAVNASPADCVRVAIAHLRIGADWVVSGINAGGNLGHDIYISGTVAAAREAAFLGVPAIAISQYKRKELDWDWERAARWTRRVLDELLERRPAKGMYFNVNLPHLDADAPEPEIVECGVCTEALPIAYELIEGHLHYTGVYADRLRTAGSDVDLCLGGKITVSTLRL